MHLLKHLPPRPPLWNEVLKTSDMASRRLCIIFIPDATCFQVFEDGVLASELTYITITQTEVQAKERGQEFQLVYA